MMAMIHAPIWMQDLITFLFSVEGCVLLAFIASILLGPRRFRANTCRLASALGGGALAGGLVAFDGLGLPVLVAVAIGGAVAVPLLLSARVHRFWCWAFARRA